MVYRTCLSWLLLGFVSSSIATDENILQEPKSIYALGDSIPISCLNRTADTGEHITLKNGDLQYVPFLICNETSRPLELYFGIEKDINCTIPFIDDPLFHLLEFYVHNDAPMTCRIPSRPLQNTISQSSASGDEYIPLVFSLAGALQFSHLHISTNLNVLVHAGPKISAPGSVAAAIAYSIPEPSATRKRIIIGDPLPLRLSVRWYPTTSLPSGWTGYGGHIYFSTVVYCLLSAGVGIAVSIAWFRGVELPKRLKKYGGMRTGGERGHGNGYGYGGGYGYGYGYTNGVGKRD
ncbi:MAG: hypothetical protein M1834_007804 [Cirrosporium novae-zelandiae]|nr:MAG: hypothetical protein M1834_007804 [Cirrosporium novae-zelandiae]